MCCKLTLFVLVIPAVGITRKTGVTYSITEGITRTTKGKLQ